ncbi:MAG: serine/threonine protein kinase, partial [Deltaproteobacteria bacterium]|nr:serine/threonine protein kinase [Deltaproteobacteria bacterium]
MVGTDGIRDTRIRTTRDGRGPRTEVIPEPTLLEPGATVGRYLILDLLGSGGMSVVYGAYDPQLDRRVALKLMRTTQDGRDQQHVRDRLLREAQSLARLAHPNVVTVHDVGTVADQVFVAMEYVEGQTLTDWLEPARTPTEVVEVMRAAGRGLAAAHEGGLVHRDFKPDNVMIDGQGRVRVMDFGLAAPSGSPSSDVVAIDLDSDVLGPHTAVSGDASFSGDALGTPLTMTGAVMGTPAYMAPEQHSGGRTGPATDQFSFCVTLHEALFGERLFDGETRADLRNNVLHGRRREPPRGRRIARRLRRTIERGLSTHPMDRWPSMSALLGQLDGVAWFRRPRSIIVAASVVGLGFIGVSSVRPGAATGDDRCEPTLSLDGVWDADERAALGQRLRGGSTGWMSDAWPPLAARLDVAAERWTAARDQICAGAAPLDPRRVGCLRRQRRS